jgi:GT2 family glycosyltransferase
MPWRRLTFRTRQDGQLDPLPEWRPVQQIQIDIDAYPGAQSFDLTSGDRVWIEVFRRGRAIAVIDGRVENNALPASVIQRINELKQIELPSRDLLSDELLSKASVVVATICEDPAELVRTVESLLMLDYPDFEIIVVDNRHSADRRPLPSFPGGSKVHVFWEPRRGVSAARNLGIAKSTGDFVAFTDDDAVVDPNWLRAMGSTFAIESDVEAIGGLVLPLELETAPQLWFEEFYGGFSPSLRFEKMSVELMRGVDEMFPYAIGVFGAGCNMAFRRSALTRIGGFDIYIGGGTLARAGEDVALALKLVVTGGTYAYEPAALVRHSHRRTEAEFLKQAFNYGTGLTALFSAMIVRDPRHLVSIVRRVPYGFRHLTRSPEARSPSAAPSYPRETLAYQILGMLYGPLAYARSVVSMKWFS